MGGKLKILAGYKGTAETDLAVERGEVDMALQNWEELRVSAPTPSATRRSISSCSTS